MEGDDDGSILPVRGERYFVRDDGGHGPAVLFLHGWPDDGSLFRRLRPPLRAAGYRTIAIDWPAHGRSSRPASARRCSTPELVADTLAILDQLAIARAHLVAHDYGATVSWETVALHPTRFLTFTAISVGHSLEILRDLATGGLLRYHWLLLHGLSASVAYYLAQDARRFKAKFARHPDRDRILQRLRGNDLMFFTVWERANPVHRMLARQLFGAVAGLQLVVPTLAIHGRDDEWMTEGQIARSARRVAADCRFRAIDGGHWIPLERPDEVASILLDWLRSPTQPTP